MSSDEGDPRTRQDVACGDIDATSDIQEINVVGDWAFMWTRLSVVTTPPDEAKPVTRAGHTLSILRKEGGKWRLARDANLLA